MTDDPDASPLPEFFGQQMANSYDEKNSKLSAIADGMHFLTRLVLADLPPRARVLCVGIGTGAEILALGEAFPEWSFVGIDPSAHMLGVCRDRLAQAKLLDRCDLIHGYVHDLPNNAEFDAVLSILVAHFIGREDRSDFYSNVRRRLKTGGVFVSTEICVDLDSAEFPAMLEDWKQVQRLMGATPDSLLALPETLRNTLSVLSPEETKALLKEAGFDLPVAFFQALLIRGWYAMK